MNMKKVFKIIAIALIVMMLVTISTSVFATTGSGGFNPKNLTGQSNVNTSGISDIGNSIVRILSTIGIVISVVVLIVLGIKYMMGSAEEKAEYKKTMIPYLIGAALVFAASSIANIIFNFMQNV